MKEIVLDTETTGISVKEGHRIVEIGCIELDNLIPTKNKFHCYLNPERKVSEKAFEVHGYSDEFLLNKKLIIKIHPSPDEYDPSELVKSINPEIDVIKSGNISELIKNCSLMILIDFSTVVLDAYVLNKPIISVPVKDNGYGLPTALTDNSILVTELNTLEQSIKKILTDNHDLFIKSKNSRENYLSNIGNSSEKLLEFLSNLSKI